MGEEPSPKRVKFAATTAGEFRVDANEVINFRLLEHTGDVLDEINTRQAKSEKPFRSPFPPGMCHRFFGDDEEIKGYLGLTIDIWISARTYHTWLDDKFGSKRVLADDIKQIFSQNYPAGFSSDKQAFVDTLTSTTPPDVYNLGTTISSSTLKDGSELRIQLHQLTTADASIQELHTRMEPLLLWFIDAASFIEKDDPDWSLLLAVRRKGDHDVVVGFATVYKFWAYPDSSRLRLSQILVMPPFQGQGVGRQLLQAAYRMAEERKAQDLTLEDPTPELQRVREKLDLQRLVALPWLRDVASQVAQQAASSGEQPRTLTTEEQQRAMHDSKIPCTSIKALWEAVVAQQAWSLGPKAQQALEQAVTKRLRGVYFADLAQRAAGKTLVVDKDEGNFIMFRNQRAAAAGPSGPTEDGVLSIGQGVGVSQVDAEEAEGRLREMVEERMQRLQALVAAMT